MVCIRLSLEQWARFGVCGFSGDFCKAGMNTPAAHFLLADDDIAFGKLVQNAEKGNLSHKSQKQNSTQTMSRFYAFHR